jgi:hypothetical protein
MPAQIGRFSRVTSVRVLPDRGSCAICDGLLSAITAQKRTSVRSHRNPVPSWHITNSYTDGHGPRHSVKSPTPACRFVISLPASGSSLATS